MFETLQAVSNQVRTGEQHDGTESRRHRSEVCQKAEKGTCQRNEKVIKLNISSDIFHNFWSYDTRRDCHCICNKQIFIVCRESQNFSPFYSFIRFL